MKKNALSRRTFAAMGAATLLASLTGCGNSRSQDTGSTSAEEGSSDASPVELQVFAANSLEKALPEVQELYSNETGTAFADTQFKASGDLVEQMRAGAAADVLITASNGNMDDAEDAGLVGAGTREDMFTNDLVIIRKEGSDTKVAGIADVAGLDGRIAIGDAATVPAGKYANQALYSVGLYSDAEGDGGEYADSIKDKVALADKVGTAAKYVSTGDCVAGFVYSSDIFRYDGVEEAFVCPEDSHKPIVYPGAVAAGTEHAKEAKKFLDFCMTSKKAQKIWAKYGFELSA